MAEQRRPVNWVQQVAAAERQALAKELSERYLAGESTRAIASSIRRANSYVRRVLLEAGVQLRPHGGDRHHQPITDGARKALARELGQRYAAGESICALAWSVGRSERFVGEVLDEAGVQRRRWLTGDARKALARELGQRYAAGESIRALASSVGRSTVFVRRLLVEAGVQRRRNNKLTPEQVRSIRARYVAGETQIALAREYGVVDSTINRIVHGNRHTPAPPGRRHHTPPSPSH